MLKLYCLSDTDISIDPKFLILNRLSLLIFLLCDLKRYWCICILLVIRVEIQECFGVYVPRRKGSRQEAHIID